MNKPETRGGKRKRGLPTTAEPSFFDPTVQRILDPYHKTHARDWAKLPEETRLEILAFPIEVFELTDGMATYHMPEKYSAWLSVYAQDRTFVADLLAAVTHFYYRADKGKLLSELVTQEADYLVVPKPTAPIRTNDDMLKYRLSARLPTWKEVADRVGRPQIDGERIRQKEYYEEKKRWLAILEYWKPHFEACYRLNIPSPSTA